MQFREPKRKSKPIFNDETHNYVQTDPKNDYILRRSKSYNSPDIKHHQNMSEETNLPRKPSEFCIKDLDCFPDDIIDIAKRIVRGK